MICSRYTECIPYSTSAMGRLLGGLFDGLGWAGAGVAFVGLCLVVPRTGWDVKHQQQRYSLQHHARGALSCCMITLLRACSPRLGTTVCALWRCFSVRQLNLIRSGVYFVRAIL